MKRQRITTGTLIVFLASSVLTGCRTTNIWSAAAATNARQVGVNSTALPATNDRPGEGRSDMAAIESSSAKIDEVANSTAGYSPEEYAASASARSYYSNQSSVRAGACTSGCCSP